MAAAARRLHATPTTTWFARRRTAASACTAASNIAQLMPQARPTAALPLARAPIAVPNADTRSLPSSAMSIVPDRSAITPAVAARTYGAAMRTT